MDAKQTFDWLSDLRPLLAAQASWDAGDYGEETIHHLKYRPAGPFAIACGDSLLAEHVRRFRFSPEVIRRLGQVTDERGRCIFSESFLNFLQRMRLRLQVSAPPEGMIVLPGEPLLIVEGPRAQALLMESAFRLLIWQSSDWATQAAMRRWEKHAWKETDTPHHPAYDFSPEGWRTRALFVGGASMKEIASASEISTRTPGEGEGLQLVWQEKTAGATDGTPVLSQIRRLYKGTKSLGDVWMSAEANRETSVSKRSVRLRDEVSGAVKTIEFTRFQNVYQPVIAYGQPVLTSTRKGFLRQRTLHQLEAFQGADPANYPRGWFVEN